MDRPQSSSFHRMFSYVVSALHHDAAVCLGKTLCHNIWTIRGPFAARPRSAVTNLAIIGVLFLVKRKTIARNKPGELLSQNRIQCSQKAVLISIRLRIMWLTKAKHKVEADSNLNPKTSTLVTFLTHAKYERLTAKYSKQSHVLTQWGSNSNHQQNLGVHLRTFGDLCLFCSEPESRGGHLSSIFADLASSQEKWSGFELNWSLTQTRREKCQLRTAEPSRTWESWQMAAGRINRQEQTRKKCPVVTALAVGLGGACLSDSDNYRSPPHAYSGGEGGGGRQSLDMPLLEWGNRYSHFQNVIRGPSDIFIPRRTVLKWAWLEPISIPKRNRECKFPAEKATHTGTLNFSIPSRALWSGARTRDFQLQNDTISSRPFYSLTLSPSRARGAERPDLVIAIRINWACSVIKFPKHMKSTFSQQC